MTHLLLADLGYNGVLAYLTPPPNPYIGFARGRELQKSMPLDTYLMKPILFVYSVMWGLYYCLPIYLAARPPPMGELMVMEIVQPYI
jgi:hypothetical protein